MSNDLTSRQILIGSFVAVIGAIVGTFTGSILNCVENQSLVS